MFGYFINNTTFHRIHPKSDEIKNGGFHGTRYNEFHHVTFHFIHYLQIQTIESHYLPLHYIPYHQSKYPKPIYLTKFHYNEDDRTDGKWNGNSITDKGIWFLANPKKMLNLIRVLQLVSKIEKKMKLRYLPEGLFGERANEEIGE